MPSSSRCSFAALSPTPGDEAPACAGSRSPPIAFTARAQQAPACCCEQLARLPFEGRVPDSWFEELLALCLHDPEIPPIELQYPIRDDTGRVVAKTDIAIPSVRLGLEAHSRRFHFGPDAEPLDEQRDLAAGTCGWDLQYLGWNATRQPAEVLAIVKRLIAARAARTLTAKCSHRS